MPTLYVGREEGELLSIAGTLIDQDESHFLAELPGFEPQLLARADGYRELTADDIFGW